VRDFERLLGELGIGACPLESLRAMAIAYTIDHVRVRSRLEATGALQRAFDDVLQEDLPGQAAVLGSRWSVRAFCCRWRNARRADRLFDRPGFSQYDDAQRRTCRRLIFRRRGPLLKALRTLTRDDVPPDLLQDARQVLSAVARDPATWSRQLVVLRTVQTLSVLDLQTYCALVDELGEYGEQ
jgi:hypothetical protein